MDDEIARAMGHCDTSTTDALFKKARMERLGDIDPVRLLHIVQDYDRLSQRVDDLERRVRENNAIDARRSSIEVGTPAKGGNMKVYFDPFAPATVNDHAVEEAQRVLAAAGGKLGGA